MQPNIVNKDFSWHSNLVDWTALPLTWCQKVAQPTQQNIADAKPRYHQHCPLPNAFCNSYPRPCCSRPFNPGLHPLPRIHNRRPCTAPWRCCAGAPSFRLYVHGRLHFWANISVTWVDGWYCQRMQLMQATPIAAFVLSSRTLLGHHNRLILRFMPATTLLNFKPTQHNSIWAVCMRCTICPSPSVNKIKMFPSIPQTAMWHVHGHGPNLSVSGKVYGSCHICLPSYKCSAPYNIRESLQSQYCSQKFTRARNCKHTLGWDWWINTSGLDW